MATQQKTKSILGTWLWRRPIQFAFLSVLAQLGLSLAWGALAYIIYGPDAAIPTTPLFVLMGIVGALVVIWLIRKLPTDKLDYKSFVTLSVAQNIILVATSVLTFIILARTLQTMFISTYVTGAISTGTIIAVLTTLIISLYTIGISIASMYATFLRMRKMDVPTWKLICTLPFGYTLYWIAGFVTDDARKVKAPVITTKIGWYTNLVNWIIARPSNALVSATVILLATILSIGTYGVSVIASICAFVIFGVWYALRGATHIRKIIPTTLATFAIVFNIVAIVFALILMSSTPDVDNVTQITIADTTEIVTQ